VSAAGANIAAAVTTGFAKVVVAVGAAALAFPGPLQQHLGAGIGAIIVGGAVATAIAAFASSIRGSVIETPTAPAVLLGLFGASVSAGYPSDGDAGALAGTIFVLFAFTAVVTGLFFVALGTLRLGNFIRFIPYPVVAGVLAGVGVLMVMGSFGVAAGTRLELRSVMHLSSPDAVAHWLPAVLCGAAFLAVSRRYTGPLVVPGMVAAALLLFYAIAAAFGLSRAELESGGWLLGPFPAGPLYNPLDYGRILSIPFDLWFRFLLTLVAVMLIATVCLLLNASALELALRREADMNRELRAIGVGNICGGMLGGLPCYHSLSATLLLRDLGASNRSSVLLLVAFWLSAAFFGAGALALFPRPVLGGVIFFLGCSFLRDWLVKTWSTLPRADWYVVLLIVTTTALIGYLEGLGLGTLAGIILFQIGYSKVPVIKHAFSAAALTSCVDRAPECCEKLKREGGRCLVLQLQGYLFFGNAHRIVQKARGRLADHSLPSLEALILDFRLVEGLDHATVTSFRRLAQMMEEAGAELIFAGLGAGDRQYLTRGGVIGTGARAIKVFDDWDQALEWYEDRLLHGALPAECVPPGAEDWPAWLLDALPGADARERFRTYLTTVRLAAGQELVRQDEQSDCLYILYSGRASIYIQQGGVRMRVKTYLAGTVIGEIGFYLGEPRTATVVVDNDITGGNLDRHAFRRMWENDPDIAHALDRAILVLLSRRLSETNRLLTSVMR
jgi:SulP family sulfate permease